MIKTRTITRVVLGHSYRVTVVPIDMYEDGVFWVLRQELTAMALFRLVSYLHAGSNTHPNTLDRLPRFGIVRSKKLSPASLQHFLEVTGFRDEGEDFTPDDE